MSTVGDFVCAEELHSESQRFLGAGDWNLQRATHIREYNNVVQAVTNRDVAADGGLVNRLRELQVENLEVKVNFAH